MAKRTRLGWLLLAGLVAGYGCANGSTDSDDDTTNSNNPSASGGGDPAGPGPGPTGATSGQGGSASGPTSGPGGSGPASSSSTGGGIDPCMAPTTLTLPSQVMGTTIGGTNVLHESCGASQTGPEAVYELTVPSTGTLLLTLNSSADLGVSVRTTCNNASSELECMDSQFGGEAEVLLVQVTQGQVLTVIVDGYSASEQSSFTLDAEMLQPESLCTDFVDNDLDTFIDCEDPNCQVTASCTPGAITVGNPCTANNQCVANMNDPVCINMGAMRFPNGYCSQFCNLTNDDCGSGGECYDPYLASGNGVCLETCTSNGDCSANYSCQTVPGATSTLCYPESCSNPTVISAGNTTGNTTTGYQSNKAPACILSSSYASELVYAYTPTSSGNLTITLTPDMTVLPDLGFQVLTSCTNAATQVVCKDDSSGVETATFAVTANTTYHIIVDGFLGDEGPFTLNLQLM